MDSSCLELLADGLMTVKQAAAFLGISVANLYVLMSRGELPYVKLGRSRRIPRRALIDLAAKNLVIPKNT
jgi:excisionase family DNA binding protein